MAGHGGSLCSHRSDDSTTYNFNCFVKNEAIIHEVSFDKSAAPSSHSRVHSTDGSRSQISNDQFYMSLLSARRKVLQAPMLRNKLRWSLPNETPT